MFKIGDFSKLTNLSVKALHHYEKLGILLPERIDERTKYRYYYAQQLEVVNKIKLLQQIGLSLKEIKKILDYSDEQEFEILVRQKEEEIEREMQVLTNKQKMIRMIKDGNFIDKYHVELKLMPKRKVMSIRKTVSSFHDEYLLWKELYAKLATLQVTLQESSLAISIYHDDEYIDENVDIEVQVDVVGQYEDTQDIKFYTSDEFTMASIVFNGSFDQMPEVTQALAWWMEANGYVICGPMLNISHVSPAQDKNPNNWVNEAGFAVRKR